MKLLTQEIRKRMPFRREQDGKGMDAIVHLKLFNPRGSGTWLITEGWQIVEDSKGNDYDKGLSEPIEDGERLLDVHFFGYCHIFEWEWGELSLTEVERSGMAEREKFESDGTYKVKDLVR